MFNEKRNLKLKSRRRKVKFFILFIAVIIVGFFTWLFFNIMFMKNDLVLSTTYSIPNFQNIDISHDLKTGSYALAVDGEFVFGENSDTVRPTASTAKMILGLAIMQEKPFTLSDSGENITIDENFYNIYTDYLYKGGSVSKVEVGEEISEYDALVSVFLPSSNNMADTLAIWAFGSLENYRNFATKMLNEWGINNTNIGIDASGFDVSTTSTATDLAKIGKKILENPVLSEIVGTVNYEIPAAGVVDNTNKILGIKNISGIKTGFIGDDSGYCLVSGYVEDGSIFTLALLGAQSRDESFDTSLEIISEMQDLLKPVKLVSAGELVGYFDSWWTGKIKITAKEDIYGFGWATAEAATNLEVADNSGALQLKIGQREYSVEVSVEEYEKEPSLIEKIQHIFGWSKNGAESEEVVQLENEENEINNIEEQETLKPITNAISDNCTINFGTLMLINPNFTVENVFISTRQSELVSISSLYGIVEGDPGNGDNLLDAEAAIHINEMVKDYESEYPGHTLETRSCFRAVGTKCDRLCAATGASDHHTGLTCDLLDPVYGTSLDTDDYEKHIDWQWLKLNSYKYGFVDRFPEAWAGGPMSEPLNVDDNGSTGLYETWHYRYVGNPAATEIATGKYNKGEYDSLEHYLKARGLVTNLKPGACK